MLAPDPPDGADAHGLTGLLGLMDQIERRLLGAGVHHLRQKGGRRVSAVYRPEGKVQLELSYLLAGGLESLGRVPEIQ
jgi:hypothetical protein